MYIYLDESGDLGFGEKASKHFVITLFIPKNPTDIKHRLKKIRRRKLKKTLKKLPEFKWNKTNRYFREIFLKELNKTDYEVSFIILIKSKVYDYLRDKKNEIYTYLSGFIIDSIISRPKDRKITVIVDKSLSRKKREEFDWYVREKIEKVLIPKPKIIINHKDSSTEPCLQSADFLSGTIFQKYEYKDESYYEIIKDKINQERIFWK